MKLKELLGEELYSQVSEKLGDHKIGILNDGSWVPKEKFDELNETKNQYKDQVDDLNQQLGKLNEKVKDNDSASETIKELQQQIADKEAEIVKVEKQNAIKFEVLREDPNDVADILPHINSDKIIFSDDGITGLKEQIETLKESKPYLFKEPNPVGTGGSLGNKGKDIKSKSNDLKSALEAHYKAE